MRFSLAALPTHTLSVRPGDRPVTVQIRPSYGVPGEHSYLTDSYALRGMLKRSTELSGVAISSFMKQLENGSAARLSGVELNDNVLHEIGYFLD